MLRICLYLFSIFISLASQIAYASPIPTFNNNNISQKPLTVAVSTYLFAVNRIDTKDGSYDMLFYIGFTCKPSCQHLNFELINGKIKSQELLIDKPNYRYYRINALLNENMNFQQFPFELQRLDIIIEDKYLNNQDLQFKVSSKFSGIENDIRLSGWAGKPYWSARALDFNYSAYDQSYSRYIFTISVTKPILSSILKTILPEMFVMLISFFGLFFEPSKASEGIKLAGSAFIPMILMHLNLTNSLPATHYINYFDSFMLINYSCLIIILLQSMILIKLHDSKFLQLLSKLFRIITPALWLLLQIINIFIFFWML